MMTAQMNSMDYDSPVIPMWPSKDNTIEVTAREFLDHYNAVAGGVKVAFNPFVGNVFSTQRSEGYYFTYTPDDFAFSNSTGTMSWKKMFLTSPATPHVLVNPCLDDPIMESLEVPHKDEAYFNGISVQRSTGVTIEDIVPVV